MINLVTELNNGQDLYCMFLESPFHQHNIIYDRGQLVSIIAIINFFTFDMKQLVVFINKHVVYY